jgi:glycosyltransferase
VTVPARLGPRISIVTVSFNSAASIGDALRSVAMQTYPNVEHIVVDGGSRDETLAVVQRDGAHVAKLVSESDKGIYDAMNKGLRLASGDYVGFLNSDDMLASPGLIARYAAAAADAPEALFADLDYVRADRPETVVRHWRSGAFRRSHLKFGWMPPHPTFY